MSARMTLLLVLAGLAGCLEPEAGPADGEVGCCGPGGPGAGDEEPESLDFQPDLPRLKRDFCANQTLELPAPRFGTLRFVGVEDRLYDGPMPCTTILDPTSTDEQRQDTTVYIDVTEASSGGVAFTIDSYSTAMLSDVAVYGGVSFVAPAGPWGDAGRYEVGYDPRDEGGAILATMARLMQVPKD